MSKKIQFSTDFGQNYNKPVLHLLLIRITRL